jgi:hypothetical protein
MRKIKKTKYNEKTIEKFIELLLILMGMCLLVFPLSGCINKTLRHFEEFKTPVEAAITVIEHDISGNDGSNGGAHSPDDENTGKTPESFVENRIENIPYYFIAVQNGQDYGSESGKKMEESFNYLEEMITKADENNIKLTLGFSKQWEENIKENPGRLAMLNEWKGSGHQIVFDDSFGLSSFALSGDAGFKERPLETGPENGINEFILSGLINGTERKWLTLFKISNVEFLSKAIKTVEKLDSSVVYGVVFHNVKEQTPFFYSYIEYLHNLDLEGLNSKTLTSIIEKKLIPEKIIPEEVLDRQYQ